MAQTSSDNQIIKNDTGFTSVTCDNELVENMTRDISNELQKHPSRKKIPYREMIALYRQAWLKDQNNG